MAKKSKVPADQAIPTGTDSTSVESNNDFPAHSESKVTVSDDFKGPEAEVVLPPKAPKAPRAPRSFEIAIGTLPVAPLKPLGIHAIVITEAIQSFVDDGKKTASREEIMERAKELGLYEKKPSVQGTVSIFSWWRKALQGNGWISATEEVAKEVAPVTEVTPTDAAAL